MDLEYSFEIKPSWQKFIGELMGVKKKSEKFHGDYASFMKHVENNEVYFSQIQRIYEYIYTILIDMRHDNVSDDGMLIKIFEGIYYSIIGINDDYDIFDSTTSFYENVFNACMFTSLGMFLHDTKRIRGYTLREFVYRHSPKGYNKEGTELYFDYNYPKKDSLGYRDIDTEEDRLRQFRRRILKDRAFYDKNPEWSGIRKYSEYEWVYFYILDDLEKSNPALAKTFYNIKNLYNIIYREINSPIDENYPRRLEKAQRSFISKLKKIKYENYLELQKIILERICKDKIAYGLNIYSLEKLFMPFKITNEVKLMLECENDTEKYRVIIKSIIMNGLWFPKLYKNFYNLDDHTRIQYHTHKCLSFLGIIVHLSRLILEKLIADDIFGKEWEALFIKVINNLTESVFYDPAKIDYSVKPKSQEMYEFILTAPVKMRISQCIKVAQHMAFRPDNDNK